MNKKILLDNFTEEERKLLVFCYQIEETLKTIKRLKIKFNSNLEQTYYSKYVNEVKKVYMVLKKAIIFFPHDEREREWKNIIRKIENENLF